MPDRRHLSACLALLLPLLACSKTEDVAPEKKIFGEPPVIETVNFEVSPQYPFSCDFTDFKIINLCKEYQIRDFEATSPIVISGTYTRVFITVRVSDPNTTFNTDGSINRSDLLLVSASYTDVDAETTPKEEKTLVLFDDGSNTFPAFTKGQVGSDSLDCSVDEFGCTCRTLIYSLASKDVTEDDSLFSRAFAFLGQGVSTFAENCILQSQQVAYALSEPQDGWEFRIDAVDRSGNLDTWGDRPIVTTGADTFSCSGDACGCCLLLSSNPRDTPDKGGCFGLQGMDGTWCTYDGIPMGRQSVCDHLRDPEQDGGPGDFANYYWPPPDYPYNPPGACPPETP